MLASTGNWTGYTRLLPSPGAVSSQLSLVVQRDGTFYQVVDFLSLRARHLLDCLGCARHERATSTPETSYAGPCHFSFAIFAEDMSKEVDSNHGRLYTPVYRVGRAPTIAVSLCVHVRRISTNSSQFWGKLSQRQWVTLSNLTCINVC